RRLLSCPTRSPGSTDRAIGAVRIWAARRERHGTKNADVTQLARILASIGIVRRSDRVAVQIHNGTHRVSGAEEILSHRTTVPTFEIAKHSVARAWSQHRRIRVGPLPVQHPIE